MPVPLQGMYLRNLYIKNFRSCADVHVRFQPTLTVLVGENNSGKTNVIEALRLATEPLSRRRTRYFEYDDLSQGCSEPINITTEYAGLTDIQHAQCLGGLDIETNNAWYTTRYRVDANSTRRSPLELLAGSPPSPDQEPEKRDQINHVYLAPLRDAKRELDSFAGNRLSRVMQFLFAEEQLAEFKQSANNILRELENLSLIQTVEGQLQEHVRDLTKPIREQKIGIGVRDYNLYRLASALRLRMAEQGIDLADIIDSGLGYANLLFMATVVLELQNAAHSELTLFLVEEPEAHLHPQLQVVLLDYLQEQAQNSLRDDRDGPAGRIQVVATTHSPNLASSAGTNSIVVMRTMEEGSRGDDVALPSVKRSVAVPLCDIELTAKERRKIDQYLDVTRAELLFTRNAILVEGIAEAVLLPVLAAKCIFPGDDDKRRRFRGVSLIAIGSVDFSPYLKLLLQAVNGVRLVDRLVVVTDGDPLVQSQDDVLEEDTSPSGVAFNRRAHLEAIAADLGAGELVLVAQSKLTLEADLMEPFEDNRQVLEAAFKAQKPKSEKFWASLAASDSPANEFYSKLRSTRNFIGKGEFAHDVARLIADGHPFCCPDYLRSAIGYAVDVA